MDDTRTIFTLPDMSCGGCVRAVTQALQGADPACTVQADLPGKRVEVASTLPREALAEALRAAGFTPA